MEGLEPMQFRVKVGRKTGDWGYIDRRVKSRLNHNFLTHNHSPKGWRQFATCLADTDTSMDTLTIQANTSSLLNLTRRLHFQTDSPVSASAIFLATSISAALLSSSHNIAPAPHTVLQKA